MKRAEVLTALIDSARPAELPELAADFARALATVVGRIATSSGIAGATNDSRAPSTDGPRVLDVNEAAFRLGVTSSWLYRNWKSLPFARKLGHRTLRFDSAGLERWLRSRDTR